MPRSLPLAALLILAASPAHAYIGPGVGLGAIAFTIALMLGLLLLVAGFLWYPLKRLIRGRRTATNDASSQNDAAS